MMKKTFAPFACAVISLSLAACGNNSTGQEKNNGSSLSASRTTETTNQEETKVTNKEYVFDNYEGTYTGEWLNGNLNGQAIIEYADGTV